MTHSRYHTILKLHYTCPGAILSGGFFVPFLRPRRRRRFRDKRRRFQGRAAQVPKQGQNLRRESAFYAGLMAQVSALKWNLHHLRLNLHHLRLNLRHLLLNLPGDLRLYIAVTGSGLYGVNEHR